MSFTNFKNPCHYTFLIWAKQFPESFHPLDMQRFYVFAKNVARYRSTKWLNYDYFEKKMLEVNNNFELENINKFHQKLTELYEYHKTAINMYTNSFSDKRPGYFQRGVFRGDIYEIQLSRDEYYNGGLTKVDDRI